MDKKTLAIVGLCVVILLFWTKILEFVGLYTPPPPTPAGQTVQVDSAGVDNLALPATADQTDVATDEYGNILPTPKEEETAEPQFEDPAMAALDSMFSERAFVVTTPLYELQFTNKGGGINKIILKEHKYLDTGMVVLAESDDFVVPDFETNDRKYKASRLPFTTSSTGFNLSAGGSPRSITFVYENDNGGRLIKKYTINPDSYDIGFELSVEGIELLGFERDYQLVWSISPKSSEKNQKDDYNDFFNIVAEQGDEISTYDDFEEGKMNEDVPGEGTKWAGLRTKYFTAIMAPQNRNAAGIQAIGLEQQIRVDGEEFNRRYLTPILDMSMSNYGSFTDSFLIYAGPLDYDELKSYENGFEEMIDFGYPVINWFSKGITWLLPKMYSVIPNYGVVILLFALMIKIVTFPLTRKQTAAMGKMKDLQPKMKKLQEKYKNDPQRLNKEMMKLYKEAGANPLSGCLPMLPQMPIFFALFTVFKSTIAFRGAHFVGYITDLSMADPYYILPIIMAGSMFIQQKMTMTDPKNKMLVYMLPIVFGYLFHTFPMGLVLYWTGFNILALLETLLVKKKQDDANLQVKDA